MTDITDQTLKADSDEPKVVELEKRIAKLEELHNKKWNIPSLIITLLMVGLFYILISKTIDENWLTLSDLLSAVPVMIGAGIGMYIFRDRYTI